MHDAIAVITGAASGIGNAVAKRFIKRKVSVWGVSRRQDRLEELAALALEHGSDFKAFVVDLSSSQQLSALCSQVTAEKRANVLINAAGQGICYGKIGLIEPSQITTAIGVNLVAPIALTNAIMSNVYDQSLGTIVNIGSIFADSIAESWGAYAATKHGLSAFSTTLRKEIGGIGGIRVIDIHPGTVNTEFAMAAAKLPLRLLKSSELPYTVLEADDIAQIVDWSIFDSPINSRVDEIKVRSLGDA